MTSSAVARSTLPIEVPSTAHQVRCPVCHALEFVYDGPIGSPVAIKSRCRRCRSFYEGELQSDGPRLRVTPT